MIRRYLGGDGMPHHETQRYFYFVDGKLIEECWSSKTERDPAAIVKDLEEMAARIESRNYDGYDRSYTDRILATAENIRERFKI